MGRLWIALMVTWYAVLSLEYVKTEPQYPQDKTSASIAPATQDTNDIDIADSHHKYSMLKALLDPKYCVFCSDCLYGCDLFKRSGEEFEGPRRIPFRPWGGKRTTSESQIPKRVPFNSWGGKRSTDKNGFHSWGGKREDHEMPRYSRNLAVGWDPTDRLSGSNQVDRSIVIPGVRRLKFSSWGGKRSDYEDEDIGEDTGEWYNEDKKTFNAWGGKRGQTFSSWGG